MLKFLNSFKSLFKRKTLSTNDPYYIKDRLHRLFTWIDQSKGDTVKQYAAEYYSNIPFKDDCDGYARTAATVLLREQYKPRDIFLVTCVTWKGEYHMVCMLVKDKEILVFDNLESRLLKVQDWCKNISSVKKMRAILQPHWEPFNADNFGISK